MVYIRHNVMMYCRSIHKQLAHHGLCQKWSLGSYGDIGTCSQMFLNTHGPFSIFHLAQKRRKARVVVSHAGPLTQRPINNAYWGLLLHLNMLPLLYCLLYVAHILRDCFTINKSEHCRQMATLTKDQGSKWGKSRYIWVYPDTENKRSNTSATRAVY